MSQRPNVDYTNNLATLATLMDNVTKTYALRVKLIPGKVQSFCLKFFVEFCSDKTHEVLCWFFQQPPSYHKKRILVLGLAYWVAILNPLAHQIVTIINSTRYDVTEPPPAVSILEGLLFSFGIQDPANVTLTPVTYAPGTNATSPNIFGAEMNRTAQLSVAIVEYLYPLCVIQVCFARNLLQELY